MDPSAMPKMYKLIYMYTFDHINAIMQDMHQCQTDRTEKFKIHFSERYGCIVKKNLAPNACRNWLLLGDPIDRLLQTFNEHIRKNVTEILNCGHSDFKIHITDLSLCFHKIYPSRQCNEVLNMFKVLKYISPSSLKTLVLQYEADCVHSDAYNIIEDELYELYDMISVLEDMSGNKLPVWCNLWSGECSNLKEVKLKNICLTYEQMERLLLIHSSNLEIIILDNVVCCSHKTISERCTDILIGLEKAGFSETQIIEKIKGEHFEHVGFSEIKLSTTFVILKELTLADIYGVLTHSQITHMLTDSPSLQSVSLHKVHCKEDEYCGCGKAVTDVGSEDAFHKDTSTASSVEELSIKYSSGIVCHINSYPKLTELTLEDIDGVLTHSQITHMLTDSPSLQSVSLHKVHCKEDEYCGCGKAVTDVGSEDASCKNTSTASSVEELSIKYSSGIVCHINSYPELKELTLKDIDKELTHSQITHMLTDSPSLQRVSIDINVHCKKDKYCGCWKAGTDEENGDAFCKSTSTASSVEQLGIEHSSRIVCHTNSYPNLTELTWKYTIGVLTHVSICSKLSALRVVKLDSIEIGHSHITWLLTSPNLEIADLSEVVCTADSMCGCYTQPSTLDLDLGTKCFESRLKEVTLCGGKEIFKHVSNLLELRTLYFEGKIEKIDNIFLTGHSLEKVVFKDKENFFDMPDYPIEPEYESCEISQELLLRFLNSISNSHLVILNKVVLTEGDADYVYETVSKMKNMHVQEFTKWKLLARTRI
ncbi:uncharacterized protein LOC123556857 [Mercenaria mercenaria]|uniref:uncharacterized protein LOC123556857 n=1 Tax=Mercenaria mercenaria TaxID=6596 RepID=UPI00234ED45B|nr:uncharacterized protein LOC123556857 [Mercenaria mercenaria]